VFGAFLEGWRRALHAPVLSISILAVVLMSVPLAIAPGQLVKPDVWASIAAVLAQSNAALAIESGAYPLSLGGAVLRSLLGFASTLVAVYILFWVFLSGGVLDRFARARSIGAAQFFASCGVYMVRFVRLGAMIALPYFLLFRVLRPHISGKLQFAAFLAAVALVNLVADFAKIRAVVEDRHSMLGALAAALRFIRRRPIRAAGLYALNILVAVGITLLWQRLGLSAAAPEWQAFLTAQVYLFLCILLKLALMASEVAFFQAELAHAAYTAAPPRVWPDSAAVEAIQNFTADRTRAPKPAKDALGW